MRANLLLLCHFIYVSHLNLLCFCGSLALYLIMILEEYLSALALINGSVCSETLLQALLSASAGTAADPIWP